MNWLSGKNEILIFVIGERRAAWDREVLIPSDFMITLPLVNQLVGYITTTKEIFVLPATKQNERHRYYFVDGALGIGSINFVSDFVV